MEFRVLPKWLAPPSHFYGEGPAGRDEGGLGAAGDAGEVHQTTVGVQGAHGVGELGLGWGQAGHPTHGTGPNNSCEHALPKTSITFPPDQSAAYKVVGPSAAGQHPTGFTTKNGKKSPSPVGLVFQEFDVKPPKKP